MFVNFNEEVQHVLKQSEMEKEALNHPYVGSEHYVLALLKNSKLKTVFNKNMVTYEKFKNELVATIGIGKTPSQFLLYTPMLKKILQNTLIEAREEGISKITPEIIMLVILKSKQGMAYNLLKQMNINISNLYHDINSFCDHRKKRRRKLLIEELGTDLVKESRINSFDPVIGRDYQINKIIEILLRKKKNNPILVGPAGVGKTAIVEGLANLIAGNKCPSTLKNKRIISLNMFSLVSGTRYRGEFEEKMKQVINELENNQDIILFIDEVHTVVGAGGAEGAIDASNILKPALARGNIKIIGATTTEEYKKYIEPDAALSRRFQKVIINEPSKKDTKEILVGIKKSYEKYHNVKIPDNIIDYIIDIKYKYLPHKSEPDCCIDILDEACSMTNMIRSDAELFEDHLLKRLKTVVKSKQKFLRQGDFINASVLKEKENSILNELNGIKKKDKIVNKNVIDKVVFEMANINYSIDDSDYYKRVEEELNKKIIGQKENINKILKALIMKKRSNSKQIFSVLISGKLHTCKTTFAKELAKQLKNNNPILEIDMSGYTHREMISKLIGTTAGYLGYDNKNNVFEKLRLNPSSIILVDNYEMASAEVKRLFMNILDNGYIEDAAGRIIDFSNSMMIIVQNSSLDKKVGFNNNPTNDLKNTISKKVFVNIEMKEISHELKANVVFNTIAKILRDYNNENIKITPEYKNKIIKLIQSGDTELEEILSNEKKHILNILMDNYLLMGEKENNIISI